MSKKLTKKKVARTEKVRVVVRGGKAHYRTRPEFKKGDIVFLRSGSPPMTVEAVNDDVISTVWYHAERKFNSERVGDVRKTESEHGAGEYCRADFAAAALIGEAERKAQNEKIRANFEARRAKAQKEREARQAKEEARRQKEYERRERADRIAEKRRRRNLGTGR